MNFLDIINQNAIDINFDAKDKQEALRHLAELLEQDGAITDAEQFLEDVFLREAEGQTGIGDCVAIPHGKSEVVKKNCVAVGKLRSPIQWESIDEQPVRLVILFAVQAQSPAKEHLSMMAAVARLLAREDVCNRLINVGSQQELLHILTELSK